MSEFVKAAITEELAPGSCKTVELSGSRIALFNVAGRFCAMDDTCAHRGGRWEMEAWTARSSPAHGMVGNTTSLPALVRPTRVSSWLATKSGSTGMT